MVPSTTIEDFDTFLNARGGRFEGVSIGGAALHLMGVVQRQTKDFDVLSPELPTPIVAAAREFAKEQRLAGVKLGRLLPSGWQARTSVVFEGTTITLTTLSRADLLKTKLFALCDLNTDLDDCIALGPTAAELAEALPWGSDQDANPDWSAHVREMLESLGRRLGHGS